MPLGMDETSEWCNRFVLVPKAKGKVHLCLDLARLNRALIRPIHRDPALNDILPRPVDIKHHTLIDASSGYINLKLDEKSSYLTTFPCPNGRYRYIRLPFRATPVGDMFQKETDELFSSMPNVSSTVDDILIVGFNDQGNDHEETLNRVLLMCRQATLKLNKDKCLFRCTSSIPLFGRVISRQGVIMDLNKVQALADRHASTKTQI